MSFGGKLKSFYGLNCVEQFLIFIAVKLPNNTVIYAHNLTFDGGLIISKINKNIRFNNKFTFFKNGSIYSFGLIINNKNFIFKCSFKLLPLKLADIGIYSQQGAKHFINHREISSLNYNDLKIKEKVLAYCKQDVHLVADFLKEFYKILEYSNTFFKINSLSSFSFHLFRTYYNNENIDLNFDITRDSLTRPMYYGGRCEVFGNPRSDEYIYHMDFSSFYTNIMLESYPLGPLVLTNPSTFDKEKIVDGFYEVLVESNMVIPILPFKCPKTKKLLFPNGIFRTEVWSEELQLFLDNGGKILKVLKILKFEISSRKKVFAEFAETCLKKRQAASTGINKLIWKLIPNSLIGRLGLKNDQTCSFYEFEEDYDPNIYGTKLLSDTKTLTDKSIILITVKREENLIKYGNVVYPAIITSKARIKWWTTSQIILKNGGKILYCDTDSIFAAFKTNQDNKSYGDVLWDTNKKDTKIKNACFANPKAYALKLFTGEEIIKIKGINKNELTFEKFEKLFFENSNIEISLEYFCKKEIKITIKDIVKKVSFENYDKRIFSPNKLDTLPITLIEKLP